MENGHDFSGSGNVEKYVAQKFPLLSDFKRRWPYFNIYNSELVVDWNRASIPFSRYSAPTYVNEHTNKRMIQRTNTQIKSSHVYLHNPHKYNYIWGTEIRAHISLLCVISLTFSGDVFRQKKLST